ncbi:hypothetical protein E2C01_051807 [Portunus trituberculatus]|uniref:Uncharacterized protein n=1 Tax=Portunus trituberculatus TaxID=210409 RepID=A0A5B7GJS7_PORTR|nr:hypothetical protein [Portunus trituberculatus]
MWTGQAATNGHIRHDGTIEGEGMGRRRAPRREKRRYTLTATGGYPAKPRGEKDHVWVSWVKG